MNEDILLDIQSYVNSYEKIDVPKFEDWYTEELYYLKFEDKVLRDLATYLEEKYGKFFSKQNLKKMMKLYVLYPEGMPYELRGLSWSVICRLLDIFDEDKRAFYIDLCFLKEISLQTLNFYLRHDLYEKFLYCLGTYRKTDAIFTMSQYEEFMQQVIDVQERIV